MFWITIIIGIVLPIIVKMTVDIIVDHVSFLAALTSAASFFFDMRIWGVPYLVANTIPFIFLAFLLKSQIGKKSNTSKPYILRVSEAIGAWVLTVGFSFLIHLDVSIPNSSTESLAYLFIPYYEIVTILLGYGLGKLVGKIILKIKS